MDSILTSWIPQFQQWLTQVLIVLFTLPLISLIIKPQPVGQDYPSISTSPAVLAQALNDYRSQQELPPFIEQDHLCQPVDPYQSTEPLSNLCPSCTHASLLKISKFAPVSVLVAQLTEEASVTINDPALNHMCISQSEEYLNLLLAASNQESMPTPTTKTVRPIPLAPSTMPIRNFSESDLWQALMSYRTTHRSSNIFQDEKVCQYARKRVQDHISLMASGKDPSEYPNPDKYPLDAHAGFAKDAESNVVFESTGKNKVSENLAYWPTAQSPAHVIEWGWDSSTEGHREAQLSNEILHGCIAGQDGFYVAIFTN